MNSLLLSHPGGLSLSGNRLIREFLAGSPAGLFSRGLALLSGSLERRLHLYLAYWLDQNFVKWKNVLQLINVLSLFLRN